MIALASSGLVIRNMDIKLHLNRSYCRIYLCHACFFCCLFFFPLLFACFILQLENVTVMQIFNPLSDAEANLPVELLKNNNYIYS